jgi:hypothetical protein
VTLTPTSHYQPKMHGRMPTCIRVINMSKCYIKTRRRGRALENRTTANAKGKAVYTVFKDLPQTDKARILAELAKQVFGMSGLSGLPWRRGLRRVEILRTRRPPPRVDWP